MASQVTSGYATEGTQYAQNGSFYILDTVPGSGSAIPGPVTVTGNLTVTGTTTLLGATAAPSLNTNTITAPGPAATYSSAGSLAVSAVSTASLSGATTNVNASGASGVTVSAAAGPVTVTGTNYSIGSTASGATSISTNAGNLSIATTSLVTGGIAATASGFMDLRGFGAELRSTGPLGNNVRVISDGGAVRLVSGGGEVESYNAARLANEGAGAGSTGRFALGSGVRLDPTMGTYLAPAVATPSGPGHVFAMVGNKAFVTTGGASATMVVTLPGPEINWIALVGQIGATATNVASVGQSGATLVFTPSNPLVAMTASIVIM